MLFVRRGLPPSPQVVPQAESSDSRNLDANRMKLEQLRQSRKAGRVRQAGSSEYAERMIGAVVAFPTMCAFCSSAKRKRVRMGGGGGERKRTADGLASDGTRMAVR